MAMDTVMSTLHVVTGVFLVGPMAVLPMIAMRSLRAGDGGAVARDARSTMIFSLASLLVVVLGFGVLGMADEQYNLSVSTPWILISIILYFVAFGLNLLAVVPALRSASEHMQAPEAGAVPRNDYRRIAISSGVVAVLLIVVVVLMVVKP